jgi:hypothetical protein
VMRRIIPRCGGFLNIRSHRAATRGGGLRAPAASAVTNPLAITRGPWHILRRPTCSPMRCPTRYPPLLELHTRQRLQRLRCSGLGPEQQAKQQQEREFEDAREIGEVDGAHQV